MSSIPPLGYDDSTFITHQHLIKAMDHLEQDLNIARKIFIHHVPKEFVLLEHDFTEMRNSAMELGYEHQIKVDRIWEKYRDFQHESSHKNLDALAEEVRLFKQFLGG
jgi:hypothetical protein